MKRLKKPTPHQTRKEEWFNTISHAIGAGLSIAAIVILAVYSVHSGHPIEVISSVVYGTTLLLMFTASALYHGTHSPRLKSGLKVLDHASIYLLIAGSYTPFMLISLHNVWGWSIFGVIWGMAILGIIFKCFFTGRFGVLSTIIYLFMGWLIVIAAKPLIQAVPLHALIWLALGGLAYTAGIVFYAFDKKYHFFHFIWHLFVLAGSAMQFFAILLYVV